MSMKKNNTNKANKLKANEKKEKKGYVSPTKTTFGKVLIWILIASMVIGSLALVIYMIINLFMAV